MSAKLIVRFVILISLCTTLLYAHYLQDCGGYQHNVPRSEYGAHMQEIRNRIEKSFCENDIKCFKYTSVGHRKHYCVQLKIPKNGRTTQCTAKWEGSGHGSSSTICATL